MAGDWLLIKHSLDHQPWFLCIQRWIKAAISIMQADGHTQSKKPEHPSQDILGPLDIYYADVLKPKHRIGFGQACSGDGLDDIPVLYGFSILKAQQVVEDIIGAIPDAFAHGEDEIARSQDLMDLGPEQRYIAEYHLIRSAMGAYQTVSPKAMRYGLGIKV